MTDVSNLKIYERSNVHINAKCEITNWRTIQKLEKGFGSTFGTIDISKFINFEY